MPFAFEDLDVYRRSLEFVAKAQAIIAGFPKGSAAIADQLRRAAMSIVLNIAESSGRMRGRDANQHLAITRGSAMECAAVLDVCRVTGLVEEPVIQDARDLLVRVVQMLSKMCS